MRVRSQDYNNKGEIRMISKPEKRAKNLIKKNNLNIIDNNETLFFRPYTIKENIQGCGTYIIINDDLLRDTPTSRPKCYTSIKPDKRCGYNRNKFIEIKDKISNKSWDEKNFALNDNIRLFLHRIKLGLIEDITMKYNQLENKEQKIIKEKLRHYTYSYKKLENQYYLHWEKLKEIVHSPKDNLDDLENEEIGGKKMPIKIIRGINNSNINNYKEILYILDNDIMNKWDP